MKKLITTVFVALSLFVISGESQISASIMGDFKGATLTRNSTSGSLRPGAPSMQEVTCTLSEDGLLTLSFLIDEGMAELTLDDGTEVFTDHFDTAAPYVTTVSDPTATISLTVTTDKGNTYAGEI